MTCQPYTDPCPICTMPIEGGETATDHIVGVRDRATVQLRVVHQPCLLVFGKNIFRDTQAALKRLMCRHCTLPLPYHTIGSASTAGPSFARCANGVLFEAA